jgi:putative ABC transport system permease protein
MLRHYFKTALRNLMRRKGYSLINIAGLAAGMTCSLLILLWIQDELNYDRFHLQAASLFRVEQDTRDSGGTFHAWVTPYPLGPALKEEVPEIKDMARCAAPSVFLVKSGDKAFFEDKVLAVDPQFLRMFTFPLSHGDAGTALDHPRSIILTENAARKYFGEDDPLGKTLQIDNREDFAITGVMKNIPPNSTLQFDMLIPFAFAKELLGAYAESWGNEEISTFVELSPKASPDPVAEKVTRVYRTHRYERLKADPEELKNYRESDQPRLTLMPMTGIHLRSFWGYGKSSGVGQSIAIFSAIAVFVLLIASINFMNLSTARAAARAKEVGMRKVSGASRSHLVCQFYGEATMTIFLALIISIVMTLLLLPAFKAITGKALSAAVLGEAKFVLGLLSVCSATAAVSGSYPALYLSALQPVRVLKGRLSADRKSAKLRKILITGQFALSLVLMIGTFVVYRQLDYMRTKKLGFEKDSLIYVQLQGDLQKSYPSFKDELLRDPKILGVTATHQVPTRMTSQSSSADWDGKNPQLKFPCNFQLVDFDFVETLKIEMAAGRSLRQSDTAGSSGAFLVNEELVKRMGLSPSSAVGRRMNFRGGDGVIVGVMKDFHFQSLRNQIAPLVLIPAPKYVQFAVIRLRTEDLSAALRRAQAVWRERNPLYPFDYRFFDEDFGTMYQTEKRTGRILSLFAVLAITIACLGLFGLAAFTAEQRTKEVGVRKTLGATAPGIALLLSLEFVKGVAISNVLAWPASYWAMKRWLEDFPYRTDLAWWIFAAAGVIALGVALLTVSFQAIKAARANPVDSLRYE